MTALSSIFTFLYVYFRYLIILMFGGTFRIADFSGEAATFAQTIIESYGFHTAIGSDGIPILLLVVGIFVIGAIIRLVRRLVR